MIQSGKVKGVRLDAARPRKKRTRKNGNETKKRNTSGLTKKNANGKERETARWRTVDDQATVLGEAVVMPPYLLLFACKRRGMRTM